MHDEQGAHAGDGQKGLRLFIAVETPPEVQQAITAAQQTLRRRGDLPVRWTNPAQAHLTLVFLGDVMAPRVASLIEALRPVAVRQVVFLLRVDGVGAFPSVEKPRVLWLGVGGAVPALLAVQRAIATAIGAVEGVAVDRTPFRPHLTLGRVTAIRRDTPGAASVAAALARSVAMQPVGWPVASFALIRSVLGAGGPQYTVMERFSLRAGEQTR